MSGEWQEQKCFLTCRMQILCMRHCCCCMWRRNWLDRIHCIPCWSQCPFFGGKSATLTRAIAQTLKRNSSNSVRVSCEWSLTYCARIMQVVTLFCEPIMQSGTKVESMILLKVGDWGRNGGLNQTAVADAMAEKARSFKPEFVISVGDNFYESEPWPDTWLLEPSYPPCLWSCWESWWQPNRAFTFTGGLTSVDDEQFDTSFVNVYHQKSLQVRMLTPMGQISHLRLKAGKFCPSLRRHHANCIQRGSRSSLRPSLFQQQIPSGHLTTPQWWALITCIECLSFE